MDENANCMLEKDELKVFLQKMGLKQDEGQVMQLLDTKKQGKLHLLDVLTFIKHKK